MTTTPAEPAAPPVRTMAADFIPGDVVHVYPVRACGARLAHTHQLTVQRATLDGPETTLTFERPLGRRHDAANCSGLHALRLTLDADGVPLYLQYVGPDGREGASQSAARLTIRLVKGVLHR